MPKHLLARQSFAGVLFLLTIFLAACNSSATATSGTPLAANSTESALAGAAIKNQSPSAVWTTTPSALVTTVTPTSTPTASGGGGPTGTPTPPKYVKHYRAYASSLASTFTLRDICAFEAGFTLKGDYPPYSKGFIGGFTPVSATSPMQGNCTFVNSLETPYGMVSQLFRGTYEVNLFENGDGNIKMTGTLEERFQDRTTTGQTKYQIAIREMTDREAVDLVCSDEGYGN